MGGELAFDRSQIRYCLSENIRMDAWEGQLNQLLLAVEIRA